MWLRMAKEQTSYALSDRLIRAISNWQTLSGEGEDDVEQLLELGADVNRLHGTLLPLHCACMVSDSYTLRLLINKGARVNEYDGYERCALHYAAERDVFCVETLLQNGADVNIGDGNQDTPLHWATFKNNIGCVKLLLQRGANVDAKDYNMDTPLSWAAKKGHLEVVKILLEYNADVHAQNLRGSTPLLQAVQVQISGLNTDMDNSCLELLLQTSCKFPLSVDQRVKILEDNRLSELLGVQCKIPSSLQSLCRYSIRRSLGYRYLPNLIPQLPVPSMLHKYLSIKS